ncbi:MAG TPA: glycosyltransferase family 87 protein [Acidobacteriaceae bacterium]|jgi:hypothetical protein
MAQDSPQDTAKPSDDPSAKFDCKSDEDLPSLLAEAKLAKRETEPHPGGPVKSVRRGDGQTAIILLCCGALFFATLCKILALPYVDFIAIWSGGRLFLGHLNPYSTSAILAIERAQGWLNPVVQPMHYPPWSLYIPGLVALLPFRVAQVVWMSLSLGLSGFSAVGLWRFFGGKQRQVWIAALVFLTFFPFGTAVRLGQVTPLMLASLTAVLLLLRSQRWFLAGLATTGLGIKPQLLWLVLIAILLWAIRERRFRFLSVAALTCLTCWAGALVFDPAALHYLRDASGPTLEISCGAGGLLRLIFGVQHVWLQWLPCIPGAAWFVVYWRKHSRCWVWRQHLPLLLLISLASSPYLWFHDFALALPSFVALAARGAWRSPAVVAGWFGVQLMIVVPEFLPIPHIRLLEPTLSALWIPFWLLASRAAITLPSGSDEPARNRPEAHVNSRCSVAT